MRLSVIITTYDQPDWLERTLLGFSVQESAAFELVVADDGSGPETAKRLDAVRPRISVPIRHVWHEDRGFRKTEILNKAILASEGDYLVFTDGDCIPRPDFLAVHRRLAEPGRFLSGGYVKLPARVAARITPEDVLAGRATSVRWLRRQGAPLSRRLVRLAAGPLAGRLLDALTPTRATWNGHNASAWRADVVGVNGFEERMGYGGLDREFGERLEHSGVRGKQVRHRALVVHLDHPRAYRDPAVLEANLRIRRETAATHRTRALVGLDRHAVPAPDRGGGAS